MTENCRWLILSSFDIGVHIGIIIFQKCQLWSRVAVVDTEYLFSKLYLVKRQLQAKYHKSPLCIATALQNATLAVESPGYGICSDLLL